MKNIKAKVITCIHATNSFIKIISTDRVFFAAVSKGESAAKLRQLLLYQTDPLTKLASTIHETSRPHKLHFSPTIAQIASVVQVHSAFTKTELMVGKC